MRKLNKAVAAVTTLAIAASMAAPAFAASDSVPSPSNQEIMAKMTTPKTVYEVDINWIGMTSFEYNAGEWDATKLEYVAGATNSSVGWNNYQSGISTHYVQVTNKSNAALKATVSAEITKDAENIKIAVGGSDTGSKEFTLKSADENIKGTQLTGTATTGSADFALSGRPASAMDTATVIGNATVTLADAE